MFYQLGATYVRINEQVFCKPYIVLWLIIVSFLLTLSSQDKIAAVL